MDQLSAGASSEEGPNSSLGAGASTAPRHVPSVAFFSNQLAERQGHGLARYARELCRALQQRGELDIIPVASWTSLSRERLAALQASTGLRLTGLGRQLTPLAWTYFDAPPIERLLGIDVDVTHAVALGYPVATRKPLVVTIHDLGPLTHPQFFANTRPWVMERSLDQAKRQAHMIICVSRSTADEVCARLGDGIAERIRVIYEGVSPEFFRAADTSCLTGLALPPDDQPFILSAGKISPRKNVHGLIQAMARIADEIPHHLVLVGGNGWDTEVVTREIERTPELRARVHLQGFVTDEQLRALYCKAALYVHPSLYEGFGLTALEAMAAGTPVIASNTSSLPEVVGAAGLLVDPADIGALADAIGAVCIDPAVARGMAERGRRRASMFRWQDCAEATAEIYRLVA